MISRRKEREIIELLRDFPAVGIIGPRQVGKTTIASHISSGLSKPSTYLDLESPSDLAKLDDPEAFFSENQHTLLVLDEIQRKPELFPILRGIIDQNRRDKVPNGQFLLLGSASVELLRQSSESLAGRIAYVELAGFSADELNELSTFDQNQYWLRGGFPESYLAKSNRQSETWRNNFLSTYLERDIPQFGLNVPSTLLRRLWTMLSYNQGVVVNYSTLARNLDLTSPSVKKYIDFMQDLFLLRRLQPWHGNLGKRLTKSPKVYVRDSGLMHALLRISDINHLLGHPTVGASWEGMVIENLLTNVGNHVTCTYYRSAAGAEIDLVLEVGNKIIAIEIKKSLAPSLTKGFYLACEDLGASDKYVVYSGKDSFPIKGNVQVLSLVEMIKIIQEL